MFKKVLEETYGLNTVEETYTAFLLAKADCKEEVSELALLIDKILYGNMGLTDIKNKINPKTQRLLDKVYENKSILSNDKSSEFYIWLRDFDSDSIKYILCAKALSNLDTIKSEQDKDNLFKLICAINMDRKHKIFDVLCNETEKNYGCIPIRYFIKDKNLENVTRLYDLNKAINKQKDINKVHCGIINVLDDKDLDFEGLDKRIKEIFDKFWNIKVSLTYDEDSINTILTIFYIMEEYFMFKWEYIKQRGLDGFIERYIYFDA